MLTHDALRKMVNEEKSSGRLSAIPESFFDELRQYLEAKSQMSDKKDDQWELDSARRLMQDMMETRERKIMTAALFFPNTETEPANLTPEEKEFFRKVAGHLEELHSRRKAILENRVEMSLVALLAAVPEFVGTDLKTYGPYKEGDIATIPEENARVIVEKKAGKIIEVK